MSKQLKEMDRRIDKKKALYMKNFKKYDTDNSGEVDLGELKKVMSGCKMTEEEIEKQFNEADVNGDGKISYSGKWFQMLEFCQTNLFSRILCISSLAFNIPFQGELISRF